MRAGAGRAGNQWSGVLRHRPFIMGLRGNIAGNGEVIALDVGGANPGIARNASAGERDRPREVALHDFERRPWPAISGEPQPIKRRARRDGVGEDV